MINKDEANLVSFKIILTRDNKIMTEFSMLPENMVDEVFPLDDRPLMKTTSMQSSPLNRTAFISSVPTEVVNPGTLENDFFLIGRTSVYFQFSSFEFGNPDSLKSFRAEWRLSSSQSSIFNWLKSLT